MTSSLLADAFDHHVWATLQVLDLLAPLSEEQLATTVPGTFGTILDTARHLVGSDRWYLFVQSGGAVDQIEEDTMSIAELRSAMEPNAGFWHDILARNPDPDAELTYTRDDGSKAYATWGVRLAQVVDHGTDHRSQIFTALTTLGIEPPEIDLWAWAMTVGKHRIDEAPPTAAH
jgi:uncharacterized damage-inducible protein DinB